VERLENSRNEKITNGSKSKKILLQSSLVKRIIDLLKTLRTLNYLKSIRR